VILLAAVVVAATLAVGACAALVIGRLPTLRGQLVGLASVAVVLPLASVVLSGVVRFEDAYDLTGLAVAASASSAALVVALALTHSIMSHLKRLRSASSTFAAGELSARAPEGGPAEMDELARSFNMMATNIEELFDARWQLISWASHDLRTPLASLQAMLEALEDGLAEPSRYLPAMQQQVKVLGGLIEDLFELARIDAGAVTLELREAPLAALVERCLSGLEAEAEARKVRLESHVDVDLEPVHCAPDKVERVLFNLLTNALRHTPSDGSVAVSVQPLAAELRVTVEDTGTGLPPESLGKMFDRFWRGDRARSGDGAGLGLAIARGLVEAHGGRIWAENRPGGGARVSFTLPRTTPA